jgi:hypothetical protein
MRAFFAPRKPNVTVKNHPERYYKTIWISKSLYEAIEFLAKFNRKSRMKTCNDLLELGISQYMGDLIAGSVRQDNSLDEPDKSVRPNYFGLLFRQWAKTKGISKPREQYSDIVRSRLGEAHQTGRAIRGAAGCQE